MVLQIVTAAIGCLRVYASVFVFAFFFNVTYYTFSVESVHKHIEPIIHRVPNERLSKMLRFNEKY